MAQREIQKKEGKKDKGKKRRILINSLSPAGSKTQRVLIIEGIVPEKESMEKKVKFKKFLQGGKIERVLEQEKMKGKVETGEPLPEKFSQPT